MANHLLHCFSPSLSLSLTEGGEHLSRSLSTMVRLLSFKKCIVSGRRNALERKTRPFVCLNETISMWRFTWRLCV